MHVEVSCRKLVHVPIVCAALLLWLGGAFAWAPPAAARSSDTQEPIATRTDVRPVALVGAGRGERDKGDLGTILESRGVAFEDVGGWLDPQRFEAFSLVVLTNGIERPGDADSMWSEDEIAHVRDYLEAGGRLLIMQWAMGNLVERGGRDLSRLPFLGADRLAYHNVSAIEGRVLTDQTRWTAPLEREQYTWTRYQTAASGLHDSAQALVGHDDDAAMAYVNPVGEGEVVYVGKSLWKVDGADADAYHEFMWRLMDTPSLRRVDDVRFDVQAGDNANRSLQESGSDSRLAGIEHIEEQLPWSRDGGWVRFAGDPAYDEAVTLDLSRHRYRAEDGHLDAIVRLRRDSHAQVDENAALAVRLHDDAGVQVEERITPLPASQIYFSLFWPEALAGEKGRLEVELVSEGERLGSASQSFEVAEPMDIERAGRIRLDVPNGTGATLAAAPMSVGVPFPPAVLTDTDHLRLVDEQGEEIPLQVKTTGRWSRYGSIRWVLCDFTIDLAGEARHVYLEYGPEVSRTHHPAIATTAEGETALELDAGRLRISEAGVTFDPDGNGDERRVLDGEAMVGAFVEHVEGYRHRGWGHHWLASEGTRYVMPRDVTFELEEVGSEKVVLRASGWFTHRTTGERFCRFVNRYVIYRDSALMRVFHTWIFTGDGNEDAIRNMGWRFALGDLKPIGFLTDFDAPDRWRPGYYLRQHDHDAFSLFAHAPPSGDPPSEDAVPARPIAETATGERAAGVVAAEGEGVRVHLGVQDFWQNFPSSLKLDDEALTFYQWPRYGREPQHAVNADTRGHAWRLWFAHEGEVLNFRLPQAITEGAIFREASGVETFGVDYGQPNSANAQGIAKTAEMWLYLTDTEQPLADAAAVFEGLRDETIRAVVDPAWMASSKAFHEITAFDDDAFPEIEQRWLENLRSAMRQVQRMGIYGKWIYGDLLRAADRDERTAGLYRTFRRSHWGWPPHWSSFARTGDTDVLRFLQANVRIMSDVGFRHCVDEDHEGQGVGTLTFRLIPWAEYRKMRSYVDEVENLWHAWHVTGYGRAREVIDTWIDAHKSITYNTGSFARGGVQMKKQYLDTYKATWDPWFLAAAQAMRKRTLWHFEHNDPGMHVWNTGPREYQRLTGSPDYRAYYLHGVDRAADWQNMGWANTPTPLISDLAFGYQLTGERMLLRRLAGLVDLANWTIYHDDEPWYYRGVTSSGDGNTDMLFTSWYQKALPVALGAFEAAGEVPDDPLPLAFRQQFSSDMRIAVHKDGDTPVRLRLADDVTITGPDGEAFDPSPSNARDDEVILPADAPAGVYRIDPGNGSTVLPISPPDTPEVVTYEQGQTIGPGWLYVQHWFHVPEGTDSFWIEFDNTPPTTAYYTQSLRQVIIWDAEGEPAWAHRQPTTDYDPERDVIRAELSVPDGHDGRLWRITMPGRRTMPMRLDPQLPPLLAHDPQRWFDPTSK